MAVQATLDDVMNGINEIRKLLQDLLDQPAVSGRGSVAVPPGTYFRYPGSRFSALAQELDLAEDEEVLCIPLRRERTPPAPKRRK